MDKNTIYFGIDISKEFFDVVDMSDQHRRFPNTARGFKEFLKHLTSDSLCIMESTGYYHLRLAYYLLENGIRLSIVNPLSVKRFIQMKLSRIKTDRSDARMIRLYGQHNELKLWEGKTRNEIESLQIVSLMDNYTKQITAIKNKIQGEKVLGKPSVMVLRSLQRSKRFLQKQQQELEVRLKELVRESYSGMLTNLESIPGLGRKTAIMLIVFTDGFNRFETSSALCSYSGLTPLIRKSGTSVNSRPRISKMGNQKLRNLLFMCSFSASKHNKACRELYQRLTNKGKNKKLALIAVSNKLLKQAFAVAKSGIPYDEEYRSVLASH